MKVLVVGNGAREHAICWKINQSSNISKLYCAPGNAGISEIASCVPIGVDHLKDLTEFAVSHKIDLVVIGPEVPLVAGLTDMMEEQNIKVFGPNQKAARLEGSKAYSKDFMKKYHIPTARYGTYHDPISAKEGLKDFDLPVVMKADGLAAGKGVLICSTKEEAEDAIDILMSDKAFGSAGDEIVMEEFLEGTEASLLCFSDGKSLIPMESAMDYKKAYDRDLGPNTGGMGSISPNPIYTDKLKEYIDHYIIKPILTGFAAERIDFRGMLYLGLMIQNDEAKVLEFNVRFGDPETEAVLPRLKSDLVDIMLKSINGDLTKKDLEWDDEPCVTVVLASGGYPTAYQKGKEITGLDQVDKDIVVFHGATRTDGDKTRTDGGRVLAVTAKGETLEEARTKVYDNIDNIHFDGMEYRKDIARQ